VDKSSSETMATIIDHPSAHNFHRHGTLSTTDIPVYTASLDRPLNEKGYSLLGLGNAGNRVFGTL